MEASKVTDNKQRLAGRQSPTSRGWVEGSQTVAGQGWLCGPMDSLSIYLEHCP
jgi:hypothetical protein